MSLLDVIKRPFWPTKVLTDPVVKANDAVMLNTHSRLLYPGVTPRRGTEEILQAYSAMPFFRQAVSKIAVNLAANPTRLYAKQKNGRPTKAPPVLRSAGLRSKAWKKALDTSDLVEIEDHPLSRLLVTPNDLMTGRTAKMLSFAWLLVVGDAFWWLDRNGLGMPTALRPLPPQWVLSLPTVDEPYYRVKIGARHFNIPMDDIVHFKDPSLSNPYGRGSGIGLTLADELDTDENAASYVSAFFYNKALPSMIVSISEADEEALGVARSKFETEYTGAVNAYRTAWTTGDVSVERLDTSFSDMELIELRKWSRDAVISAFGLSPEMLGILDDSNRATMAEARIMFSEHVLVPWLDLYDTEITRMLVPLFDDRIVVKSDDPVPDDLDFQRSVTADHPWAFSKNDVRALAGAPPTDDGEYYIVSGGMKAIQSLEELEGDEEPEPSELEEPQAEVPDEEDRTKGYVRKAVDPDNVLQALLPERMTLEVMPVATETMQDIGSDAAAAVGAPNSFTMLNPLVTEYLDKFAAEKITGLITETTREAIRKELIEGVRSGEGIPDLANRIRSVFREASRSRARTIARTEVVGMANRATYAAHEMSGVVSKRQWVATPDVRTRPSHLDLNGKAVDINEPFRLGTLEAMHPGGFGIAEEDINCRCTTIAVVGDELAGSEQLTTVWKDFDALLTVYEDRMEKAVRRAFSAQREDILNRLFEEE